MTSILQTGLIPTVGYSSTPIKTIIGYEDVKGLGTIEHSVLSGRSLTLEEIKEEKAKLKKRLDKE